MTDYTREQLAQLYKKLPKELQDWTASDETNDAIYQVLERNDLLGDEGGKISDLIRNVLFGLLPPEDFQNSLEKETDLKPEIAKHIGQEINRFIFFPVKEALAELYHPSTATTAVPAAETTQEQTTEQQTTVAEEALEAPRPVSKTNDDYQEKIE